MTVGRMLWEFFCGNPFKEYNSCNIGVSTDVHATRQFHVLSGKHLKNKFFDTDLILLVAGIICLIFSYLFFEKSWFLFSFNLFLGLFSLITFFILRLEYLRKINDRSNNEKKNNGQNKHGRWFL